MKTLIAIVAASMLLSGCVGSAQPADIAVASYPAAFVAQALAGDDLVVVDLAGASKLHDFEPSARDLDQLRKSTYLVLWDEALESWAHTAQGSLGSSAPTTLEISRLPAGEDFLDGEEEEGHEGHGHGDLAHDPHTWNDPLAMKASVQALEAALVDGFPEFATNISARADTLVDRLDALHAAFEAGLTDCARDTIITNHEAYNYLAHRYDFRLFALHGIEPGSEPSPATVDEAIRTIKELGLPVIFIEEGTDASALKAIQDETGVAIRVLTTSEARPASGDYVDSQYRNLQELASALGCM